MVTANWLFCYRRGKRESFCKEKKNSAKRVTKYLGTCPPSWRARVLVDGVPLHSVKGKLDLQEPESKPKETTAEKLRLAFQSASKNILHKAL